jgi:glutathione S-transferase
MRLYPFLLSPPCQKVVALAYEVGVPLELVAVDLFRGESRTPEMLGKNPHGKVPILEDGDFVLWESNAMLGYIAAKADRNDLAPTTARERADVDRWLSWHGEHFGPAIGKVAFERVVKKRGAPDRAIVEKGSEAFVTERMVARASLQETFARARGAH